jgi:lambda repressor-like predicted transcriptional regulator
MGNRKRRSKPLHSRTGQKKPKHLESYGNDVPFEHGKPWMYAKKVCWPACFECYEAARKYRKKVVYRRETGQQTSRVNAESTRELIRNLVDKRGFSLRYLAEATGVHENTIRRMYRQDFEMKYTMQSFADKIEEIHLTPSKRGDVRFSHLVDATLARNAIRGLMRQGWDQEWIAQQTGIDRYAISRICTPNNHTRFIKPENEKLIVELARQVGSSEGTSTSSRNYAIKMKWAPTIMFDELL